MFRKEGKGIPGRGNSMSQVAYSPNPICVTIMKLINVSILLFFICKIEIIKISTPQDFY